MGPGLEQTPLLLLHPFVYDVGLVQRVGNSDQIDREVLHGQKSTLVPALGCGDSWAEIRHLQKAVDSLCAHPRV